jgi:glycosyltransferase involved in cell wall biosynthesis
LVASESGLPQGVSGGNRTPIISGEAFALDDKVLLTKIAREDLRTFLGSSRRIAFPSAELPELTVIVVLWNQAHHTLRCLRALYKEVDGGPSLEVVVVDNASTDETGQLLSRLDGVRTIRNAENEGFLLARNRAALATRGRALLLLNSDVFVRPGALGAALAGLYRAEDIGAVGGRLILPSGLLQEAGCIVWSDGSTAGYLRNCSPETGDAMFRRDVDYCSGAFLMTRRSLWEKLGGFDEAYAPCYYEEADYCMRLREAGFRFTSPRSQRITTNSGARASAAMRSALCSAIENLSVFAMLRRCVACICRARRRISWPHEHALSRSVPGCS